MCNRKAVNKCKRENKNRKTEAEERTRKRKIKREMKHKYNKQKQERVRKKPRKSAEQFSSTARHQDKAHTPGGLQNMLRD